MFFAFFFFVVVVFGLAKIGIWLSIINTSLDLFQNVSSADEETKTVFQICWGVKLEGFAFFWGAGEIDR